jgi:hypothetical protein
MRKKHKMAVICRSLRKKLKNSPVLKSPTHIGFIDVKKMGRKSHTLAHLNSLMGIPASGMEKIRFQDRGWKKFGSGINIPEPQHLAPYYLCTVDECGDV